MRRLRSLAYEATTELAETLEAVGRGLRQHDMDELGAALVRGRASESVLADWQDAARRAEEIARVGVNRAQRDDIHALVAQAVLVDRAMRSVRLLARRAPTVLGTQRPQVGALADEVERFAGGTRLLASAVGGGGTVEDARRLLVDVAAAADPHAVGGDDLRVASLVVLLRSPVVDALEASGLDPRTAREHLPEL